MSRDNDEAAVLTAVTGFFTAVENGDWDTVAASLTDQVEIAHGQDRQTLTPLQLASQWRQAHTGYATTRYQLDAVHIEVTQLLATARFASQVTLTPTPATETAAPTGNGHYTIELERAGDTWHIRTLRHDPN